MRSINNFIRIGGIVALLLGSALPASAQKSAASLYREAQAAERNLHKSKTIQKKKSAWIAVGRKYRSVVLRYPKSGYCDDALYFEGEIYREVYRRFNDANALKRALDAYLLIVKGYPRSKWVDRAHLIRGKLFLTVLSDHKSARAELDNIIPGRANSPEAREARKLIDSMRQKPRHTDAKAPPPDTVAVHNIRHWSGRDYTRIVIDMDKDVRFQQGRLENPYRIYFDLLNTRLSSELASRTFPIKDGLLEKIRVGANRPNVVRVVLDFKRLSDYIVFSLPDPYRLVVDILGTPPKAVGISANTDSQEEPSSTTRSPTPGTKQSDAPSLNTTTNEEVDLRLPPVPTREGYSTARQLGLVARRILIDPGHGGHDPGTLGNGLREKDLTLDISRRVANLLEKDGELEVTLTRDSDVFIPLEERTAIANTKEADLFLSIHINASRSSSPRGLETFYLNLATTPDAEEVAARENAVSTRRIAELQDILEKVMNNSKIQESREMAHAIQDSMAVGVLQSKQNKQNRGVKTAPLYVLLGANMPAVLVEVGFITNTFDAKDLRNTSYREKLALAIANGVRNYHSQLMRVATVAYPNINLSQSLPPGH